jgi:hypothetical protein
MGCIVVKKFDTMDDSIHFYPSNFDHQYISNTTTKLSERLIYPYNSKIILRKPKTIRRILNVIEEENQDLEGSIR